MNIGNIELSAPLALAPMAGITDLPFRLICRRQAVNRFGEVPVHDEIQLVQGQADPVIGHASLREIIGADPFTAVAGPHLALAVLGRFGALLLHREFEHFGPQHAHRLFLVLQLGFIILALHHYACRQMGDADR